MYTSILYFIIVISLYTLYELPETPRLTGQDAVIGMIAGYAVFYLIAQAVFARLASRYGGGRLDIRQFSTLHARCIDRCWVTAIIFFAAFVYGLDLPYYCAKALSVLPGGFFHNLCGIAAFISFLLILWHAAYPSYQRFYHHQSQRGGYIGSHVRMAAAIVLPWLLCTAVFDLIGLLPETAFVRKSVQAQYGVLTVVCIGIGMIYPWLLVRIWRCKPLPHGMLRDRLEALCSVARCRCADIMLWDLYEGRMITAGVLGFIAPFRYLLISPALLGLLDQNEFDAVAAHEIGHVRHRHLLLYVVFVIGYLVIAAAVSAWAYLALISHEAFIDHVMTPGGGIGTAFAIASGFCSLALLVLYFRGLFGFFSRNFERQADGYAVKFIGSGSGIASSLAKIAHASAINADASNWHHFGIRERIEYINRCTADPELAARHDRKIRRMLAGYGLGVIAAAALLWSAQDRLGSIRQNDIIQKVVERKLAAEPGNAALHLLLANIYYEQRRYQDAEAHYRTALRIDPMHPETLNNLAWLYATAEDARYRDPEQALQLALRAAELDPQPHILDTLAESYYANGAYAEAVATIKRAISQKPDDAAYYQRQLEKFEERLKAERREDELPADDDRIAL